MTESQKLLVGNRTTRVLEQRRISVELGGISVHAASPLHGFSAFRAASAVAEAKNEHCVALDEVAKNVRPHGRHLAGILVGNTTATWKLSEAVRKQDKPSRQPYRSQWILRGNVGRNRLELLGRCVSPDDLVQSVANAGPG